MDEETKTKLAKLPVNILLSSHPKLIAMLAILSGVALTPFVVRFAWIGDYVAAGFIALVVGLLVTTSRQFFVKGTSLFGGLEIIITAGVAIAVVIEENPISITYWCFPFILASFLMLKRQVATVVSSIFAIYICYRIGLLHSYIDGIRLFISIGLSIFLANAFIKIVETKIAELEQKASTDPLTGTYNRLYLVDRLREEISQIKRYKKSSSIALLDLDNFKKINDEHGHDTGDKVLIDLVKVAKSRLRESDMIFRFGGEEFLILFPNTSSKQAYKVVDDLKSEIAEKLSFAGKSVTFSAGITDLSSGETVEDTLKRADNLLYDAKNNGRNQCAIYNDIHNASHA